jgi:tetratricopeptide (TPR) repeat protein
MTTEQAEAVKFKEGNDAFKNGNWDSAAKLYTKAINLQKTEDKDLVIFLKNRAAAYLKLKNYDAAVSDCDKSLAIVPNDPKALYRRCQALECLERYEEAYRGATQIFKDDPNYKMIPPVLERLHRIVQERSRQNAQTSTKIESMTKIAFDLTADKEKRETAMNNLLVLARENAGSSMMINSPIVQQIRKLLKVEKNRELYITGVRIIGELCKHDVDKTRAVMKDVGIPWFLEILDSNCPNQVNAAQYCIQQILNIFSGMDNKPDTKPDKELCTKHKKDIDMILTCLVYSINNRVISGLARDAIIELLIRNIHYTTLSWAGQLVDGGGVGRFDGMRQRTRRVQIRKRDEHHPFDADNRGGLPVARLRQHVLRRRSREVHGEDPRLHQRQTPQSRNRVQSESHGGHHRAPPRTAGRRQRHHRQRRNHRDDPGDGQ